jgi:hypothetical protein
MRFQMRVREKEIEKLLSINRKDKKPISEEIPKKNILLSHRLLISGSRSTETC